MEADLRYDDTKGEPGRLVMLEINTQPGMTPLSLVPEIAARAHVEALDRVIDRAMKEAGKTFAEIRARLAAQFADMKLPGELEYTHTLDMRFVGQAFEVGIEIPADKLSSLDARYLSGLFADAHHRTFMHGANLDRPVEIVTLRVGATLPIGTPPSPV